MLSVGPIAAVIYSADAIYSLVVVLIQKQAALKGAYAKSTLLSLELCHTVPSSKTSEPFSIQSAFITAL